MSNEEILKHCLANLSYKDGSLYWKSNRGNQAKEGYRAGHRGSDGYMRIKIFGKNEMYHRIIYLMHNNTLPEFLDHKDRNPGNNRIENLRECTRSQNMFNRRPAKNSKSGYRGVSLNGRWRVKITIEGKEEHLGYFDSKHDAARHWNKSALIHHGEFAYQNTIKE